MPAGPSGSAGPRQPRVEKQEVAGREVEVLLAGARMAAGTSNSKPPLLTMLTGSKSFTGS